MAEGLELAQWLSPWAGALRQGIHALEHHIHQALDAGHCHMASALLVRRRGLEHQLAILTRGIDYAQNDHQEPSRGNGIGPDAIEDLD